MWDREKLRLSKEFTDVIKYAFGKTAEECGRMPWGKTKRRRGRGDVKKLKEETTVSVLVKFVIEGKRRKGNCRIF